eukprot:scpid87133/ scgid27840/ 
MDTGMETSSTPSNGIVGILEKIQASMQSIADRVTRIEDSQRQNPSTVSFLGTSTPYKEQSSKSWPDDTSTMEELGKETEELDSKGVKLYPVSDSTMSLLKSSFRPALPNPSRQQIRDKFGAPNCPHSACPGLNKVMKSRMSNETKSRDKQLARLQSSGLDAVGPLTRVLEGAESGEISACEILEAV